MTGRTRRLPPSPPTAETVVRARGLLPSLSPAEQRVAQVIIDEAATASRLTITDLAERAGSSETTVIRFCRAMGFAGYSELRLTLAAEAGAGQAGRTAAHAAGGSDISEPADLTPVVN